MSAKSIIFVCVSNSCRSPMAEQLMRYELKRAIDAGGDKSLESYTVISRALSSDYEPEGSPASQQGVTVMREDYGIDMTAHRSKMLSLSDVADAFLIVPVTRSLGSYIAQFPGASGKILFLSRDISDPWRAPVAVFRDCAKLILSLLPEVIEKCK